MRRTHTKVIGRTFAAAGVVAVAMTSGVDATTLLDIGFGTSLGGSTPRSTAMGSTGVALWQGSDALVFNPATMVSLEPGVHLDVALSMSQVNEDRLVPIFDSFQGFLDEGILAINRSTYASGQGGVVWRLPIGMPMSVGAGVFDRYDFDYDFFQEVRSEGAPDSLIRNNTLEVEGRLRSISAGYGAEIFRNARLGFSLHRYFGTVNGLRGVETPATTIPDTITTLEQELSGWGWSVGGHYRLNERVDFAASFDGPFDVDGATNSGTVISRSAGTTETTASGQRLVSYPAALRLGAAYRPRNVLRTVFEVDITKRYWKGTDEANGILGQPVPLRDTWDFGLGAEHVFYNEIPLRFGFRYLENYADGESERSIFSVGTAYNIANTMFSVTGLYHRQTSRQDLVIGGDVKVEDSIVQLVVGAERRF